MTTAVDLISGARMHLRLGRAIGEGAQAQVVQVSGGHNGIAKLFWSDPDSPVARHLIALVRVLDQNPNLRSAVPACPVRVVSLEGRVATLAPFVPGVPLDATACQQLHTTGLEARLRAGLGIAAEVRALQQCSLVHGDITQPNILLLPATGESHLVDVEGGGVVDSRLGRNYLPELRPLVRGRFEGSYMPPELVRDPDIQPSLLTDRWSLAVALHRLLIGLDPFHHVPKYADLLKGNIPWPPPASPDTKIEFHRKELLRVGTALHQDFHMVFSGAVMDVGSPTLRTSPNKWQDDLERAIRWVAECSCCGEAFMAEHRRRCPFCYSTFITPTVWTTQASYSVTADVPITGSQLGLPDPAARPVIAWLRRQGRSILLTATRPVYCQGSRAQLTPGQTISLDVGRHEFLVRPPNRGLPVSFRVAVP